MLGGHFYIKIFNSKIVLIKQQEIWQMHFFLHCIYYLGITLALPLQSYVVVPTSAKFLSATCLKNNCCASCSVCARAHTARLLINSRLLQIVKLYSLKIQV
jgi:hypothetical protein